MSGVKVYVYWWISRRTDLQHYPAAFLVQVHVHLKIQDGSPHGGCHLGPQTVQTEQEIFFHHCVNLGYALNH